NDLTRELDFLPRETVQVILYTDRQYFDVTQAPAWAGALNDGKLRIPISGLTAVTSDVSRTLRHELAHSFIAMISKGRAPTWLHDGIAQLLEPKASGADARRLAALYKGNHNIPLNELEGPFTKFNNSVAVVAYAQSLISAEYIREVYGMNSLVWILKRL